MYQLFLPLLPLRLRSERAFSAEAGVSRGALREVFSGSPNLRISTIKRVADYLDMSLHVMMTPKEDVASELSTVGTSFAIIRDGFRSWKIHFMNMVDEFRRKPDPRLVLLPPPKLLDPRLRALCASIVCALSDEVDMDRPLWAERSYYLEQPWFPSEIESLKAMNVLESPFWFRRNNIFVGENFLNRA